MSSEPRYAIRTAEAVAEVPAADWDGLAAESGNPFVAHAFLGALEDAGCVGAKTGWLPRHLVLEGPDGVEGVAPCYLKSHSRGEYVFDWGWAEAYERAGGSYYPKLQVSVPFTSVTGRRLLVPPSPDAALIRQGLIAALRDLPPVPPA